MERFARKFELKSDALSRYFPTALAVYGREGDAILRDADLSPFTYMREKIAALRDFALQDKDNALYCHILRLALLEKDSSAIGALGAPCRSQKSEMYDTLPLFALLAVLPEMRAQHERLGIPKDVTESTCAMFENQVQDFIDLNHRYGISAYTWWMAKFLFCEIIRVGRFNLEICTYEDPYDVFCTDGVLTVVPTDGEFHRSGQVLGSAGCEDREGAFSAAYVRENGMCTGRCIKNGLCTTEMISLTEESRVLTRGDRIVSVHIPCGGALDEETCGRDLKRGGEIIRRCYGDFAAFYCHSWLLDLQLYTLMGRESNITKFASRFTRFPVKSSGADVYEYVFLMPSDTPPETLVPKSSFAERVRRHLMDGGYVYGSGGVFLAQDVMSE